MRERIFELRRSLLPRALIRPSGTFSRREKGRGGIAISCGMMF
jgi:hypothetical protein